MFVSIVEGVLDPSREEDLLSAWEHRPSELPAGLIESFLLRGDAGVWRIVTMWASREAVMAMRARGLDASRPRGSERHVGTTPGSYRSS